MFNRLGTDFTARLKIFPPCCREWRLWSGNALALHTLPLSPGTLCGGIWQACGWSPAWSCISSSFPYARLSCACPLPVTQGLSPASTEVRRWPWPCTSTIPSRPHRSCAVVVSVQSIMSPIQKHERSSPARALVHWLFPVPHEEMS